MKLKFLVIFLTFFSSKISAWSPEILQSFNEWTQEFEFSKNFSCEAERNRAIAAFLDNKAKIEAHNKIFKTDCNSSYSLGLWDYSHLTDLEVNEAFNGLRPEAVTVDSRVIVIGGYYVQTPVQKNFNWATEGAVTPVRNQGGCACCYAFASTGALEGQIFRKHNYLIKLSDQQLVDCSDSYGNAGCQYGSPINAYKYIKDNGIAAGVTYPFRAKELDTCYYNEESQKKISLIDYRYVPIRSNGFLRDLLFTVGPLVVGVNSSSFTFQNYKSGIYNDPACVGGVDHAVLLTGFGNDERYGDYWVIKNSYGKNWGESGFMRMTREINNFCGIWELVVFPIVD